MVKSCALGKSINACVSNYLMIKCGAVDKDEMRVDVQFKLT